MKLYPFKFEPIYKEKIWGGRNLERLFGRELPAEKKIGESWEISDLAEGTSIVANGPQKGSTITELTQKLGPDLLGKAKALENGRFPLLLKLLDANDILSLQVHPDEQAVKDIGPDAALKTECLYIVESRGGYIYKGLKQATQPEKFRQAIEDNTVEQLVKRYDVTTGDFHYVPAGTVHAYGAGIVIAEIQTPSDTTYRVTDWGRGREIHVDMSMRCIHFAPASDERPGASGDILLRTDFFTVSRRNSKAGETFDLPAGRCSAMMMLSCEGAEIHHEGDEPVTAVQAGDTVLLPAALKESKFVSAGDASWLEVTLPEN